METTALGGHIYYLDRPNIDTDQIISAKHLTVVEKSGLGEHLFEDLDIQGFERSNPVFQQAKVLVARKNFGCGSSREHAVWAIEDHGINMVIAPSFARIFRENMFACGLLAVELSEEEVEKLFEQRERYTDVMVDLERVTIEFHSGDENELHRWPTGRLKLSELELTQVRDGGLVGYLQAQYGEGGETK